MSPGTPSETDGGDSFAVVDASRWAIAELEPAGSDEKVWLTEPGRTGKALFKPNRPHEATEQGEDWPEKIASELAHLLGVPAASVDLAQRHGQRGCLSSTANRRNMLNAQCDQCCSRPHG